MGEKIFAEAPAVFDIKGSKYLSAIIQKIFLQVLIVSLRFLHFSSNSMGEIIEIYSDSSFHIQGFNAVQSTQYPPLIKWALFVSSIPK